MTLTFATRKSGETDSENRQVCHDADTNDIVRLAFARHTTAGFVRPGDKKETTTTKKREPLSKGQSSFLFNNLLSSCSFCYTFVEKHHGRPT